MTYTRMHQGPLDDATWPSKLTARVVTSGPRPALHGYDVETDLARHYGFVDAILLSLRGELPSASQTHAFEIACHFLGPAPVNEAPTHAAVVARICNVSTSAILGTVAIGLAEQARVSVSGLAEWLAWLKSASESAPQVPIPQCALAADDEERRSVRKLKDALRERNVLLRTIEQDVGRTPAILAAFYEAGLTREEQMEVAWVLARMPSALAEALATPSHSYEEYPVLLPQVVYVDPR